MVTATEIAGLRDDEVIINSWLADDLGAKVGDELTLEYFVVADQRKLKEESRSFRISEIKPLESPDTSWTPPFPGVSEAENCRDWDPGIFIDTSRIRPKDEDYWDKFRGTPKAFISLKAGQEMWQNRFGDLTAIRYPARSAAELERVLAGETRSGAAWPRLPAGARPSARRREGVYGFRAALHWLQFFPDCCRAAAHGDAFRVQPRATLRRSGDSCSPSVFGRGRSDEFFCSKASPSRCSERRQVCWPGFVYTKLTLYGLATVWRTAVNVASFQFSRPVLNVGDRHPRRCVGRDCGDVARFARAGPSSGRAIAGERRRARDRAAHRFPWSSSSPRSAC